MGGAIEISTHDELGEVLVGPSSFECVTYSTEQTIQFASSSQLQWIFISILHQGSLDHPERYNSTIGVSFECIIRRFALQ